MFYLLNAVKTLYRLITPRTRQVLAAVSVGLLMAGMMSTWGYPAAALPQMEEPGSGIHLSVQQSSWFATVTLLMCIPGSLAGAALYESVGPRRAMLAMIPLLCITTVAMTIASHKTVQEAGVAEIILLICRVMQGSVVGLLNPFVSVYVYEVSDQHIRGTLTSLIEVWATLGYLLSYTAGCFLSWSTIAWILPGIIVVPAFFGILLSPESPLWLARKGKEKEAREVLSLVRCTEEEAEEDMKTVQNNLAEESLTFTESFQKVACKSNVLAMIASSLMLITNQLTGFSVISIYVVYIFNQSGVGLDPGWSSVVVGTSRIICSGIAAFLLHRLSRRLMFVVGNVLTGIASLSIGIFFYLQSNGEDVSWLTWLPLAGLVMYMVGYATAVGPTTWTAAVEVLPGPVRSMGVGIGTTNYAIAAFAISKLFIELQELIGLHGVFWLFSVGSVSYIMLVLLYVPETYGRSMQDIEDYWTNTKRTKKNASFV